MAAVQVLQGLKNEFKQVTGRDYDPNAKPVVGTATPSPASSDTPDSVAAWDKVQAQGDVVRFLRIPEKVGKKFQPFVLACSLRHKFLMQVRKLKADKAPKDEVTGAVQILLSLKAEYKQATGQEWDPKGKPSQGG